MNKKWRLLYLLIAVVAGCSRVIVPRPEFTWPEMASSKIYDSLGIYIPAEKLNMVNRSNEDEPCCEHKALQIGRGVVKAITQSSNSVFIRARLLGQKPTDTYIKSLNLRGVLNLKDLAVDIDFIPFVEEHKIVERKEYYNIKINISLNLSAIDFTLSNIQDFHIEATEETSEPIPPQRVNRTLEELTNTALEKAALDLARKIMTIYGART
jgi:hypothetical protein